MMLPESLIAANREFASTHPGESSRRQPVHIMVAERISSNARRLRTHGCKLPPERALAE